MKFKVPKKAMSLAIILLLSPTFLATAQAAQATFASGCPSSGKVCFRLNPSGTVKNTSQSDSDTAPDVGIAPDYRQAMNSYIWTTYNSANWGSKITCVYPGGSAALWVPSGGGGLSIHSWYVLTYCAS
jgi:hypothetical protein